MKRLIIKWLGINIDSLNVQIKELKEDLSTYKSWFVYQVAEKLKDEMDYDEERLPKKLAENPEFIKALVKAINEYQVK